MAQHRGNEIFSTPDGMVICQVAEPSSYPQFADFLIFWHKRYGVFIKYKLNDFRHDIHNNLLINTILYIICGHVNIFIPHLILLVPLKAKWKCSHVHHVVVLHSVKTTLTKVEFFFEYLPPYIIGKLGSSGASVALTSQFPVSATLLWLNLGNRKLRNRDDLEWHNVQTKHHAIRPTDSEVEIGGNVIK
jgi:hypothetical protein